MSYFFTILEGALKRKKILFLIRALAIGGAERQLVNLVNHLSSERFDIYVLCFYSHGSLRQELRPHIHFITLHKKHRWDLVLFFCKLFYCLYKFKPDVIFSFLPTSNVLASFLKFFTPKTKLVWNIRASNMDIQVTDWFSKLENKIEKIISSKADCIIFNSTAGKEFYSKKGYKHDRMIVIHNGIDTFRFYSDKQSGINFRKSLNIPLEVPLIGMVGRLDPIKDYPTFLKAASLFYQKRKNIRFICVGQGPLRYEEKLKTLTRELGLGECLVWVKSTLFVHSIYNALSLLTNTSLSEGFPNVVAEAMSCGVPCVVTPVGDSSYLVGEEGVIVPPKNPEMLIQAWEKVLTTFTPEKSLALSHRIQENFSLLTLTKKTEEVLCN